MNINATLRNASLLLFLFFTLISCQKLGDAPAPVWSNNFNANSGPSGSMTCKLNGSTWTAANGMANASVLEDISNITGMDAASSTITITIDEALSLGGTYDLGFNSGNGAVYLPSGGTNSWLSHIGGEAGGSLHITAMDTENKLISGTFEFVAVHPMDNSVKTATEGQFTNLSYGTSVSGPSENIFNVDVDGEPFVPAAINGIIMDSKLRLVASDNQGVRSVAISMPEDIEPGTYELGSPFGDLFGSYNHDASTFTNSSSGSGSLTITTHESGFIEGTFYFTSTELVGSASFELTNGEFAISY